MPAVAHALHRSSANKQLSRALVTVSEKCTHIRNLSLTGVEFRSGDLRRILSKLKELWVLCLVRIDTMVDDDLVQIGRLHGGTLVRLSIQECTGANMLNKLALSALLQQCSALVELRLHWHAKQLVCAMESLPPTLRSLYISSNNSRSVKEAISIYGKRLVNLGLYCGNRRSRKFVVKIVRACRGLQKLYVMCDLPQFNCVLRAANANLAVTCDAFPEVQARVV